MIRPQHGALLIVLFSSSYAFYSHPPTSGRCHAIHMREVGAVQCQRAQPGLLPHAAPMTRSDVVKHIFHGLGSAVAWTLLEPRPSIALESDEFEETFDGQAIGIELKDVSFKGSSRVLVKRIIEGSAAAGRPRIKPDLVLISANGQGLERVSAPVVKEIIKSGPRPLTLTFRDPSKQEEQIMRLLSSEKSSACDSCRGARRGDLLEIEYTGKLEDGKVFDGSRVMVNGQGMAGRAGDSTFFFVLGKQPKGQFPPGWDLLLTGMCVGETRVISVPPVLGYGSQGLPRRGVPANANLLYDVKLVGMNGVNMCVS